MSIAWLKRRNVYADLQKRLRKEMKLERLLGYSIREIVIDIIFASVADGELMSPTGSILI